MHIMRHLIVIGLLLVLLPGVKGQIPRTNSGQFEYTGEIITENTPRVIERARSFFNQPFLVHWDSIAREERPENMQVTGTGHITVKAKQRGLQMPSPIPVSLCMKIEIRNGHYRYTINHFVVNSKNGGAHFPLEYKPDSVKSIVYDQLIQNTHKRVSFMIGWLKKYMKGEE
jgi:hypothetical protein